MNLDETHDLGLRSWVASANGRTATSRSRTCRSASFRRRGGAPRVGVAIGDAFSICRCVRGHCSTAPPQRPRPPARRRPQRADGARAATACGRAAARPVASCCATTPRAATRSRADLSCAGRGRTAAAGARSATTPISSPAIHHATNVGRLFRPDNPLLPNYKYVPVAYHGRASSVRRERRRRCAGRTASASRRTRRRRLRPEPQPRLRARARRLVGAGNALGEPVPIADAGDHIFGFCLLNDWSARDIQAWEYQPLGPFLARASPPPSRPGSSPRRRSRRSAPRAFARPEGDPAPLPYLADAADQAAGGLDIVHGGADRRPRRCARRRAAAPACRRGNSRRPLLDGGADVAHHASNGCNLRPGDLLGSGTMSGPERDELGSLLEITPRGTEPVALPTARRAASSRTATR